MQDWNDLYYFHAVVTHQGFSAAARQIGVPKGTLSKRVARLEAGLQARLLERSTRRVRTTELGAQVYDHCQAMFAGAEAAEAAAAQAHAEPQGIIRVSCPQGLIQDLLAELLPRFMEQHPRLRVQMKVFNRRADLVDDRVDIALRARLRLDTDPALIVRTLGSTHLVLAMSPALRAQCGQIGAVEQLSAVPTLSMNEDAEEDVWALIGPAGETRSVRHGPRLLCSNFDLLRQAAIDGLGVALLPEHICRQAFASGALVPALPGWRTEYGIIHAVFASRKGLLPGIRAFIDFLAREVPRALSPAGDGPAGDPPG